MKEYPRSEERTGVQEASDFGTCYDVQSDFVMVYGLHNLKERIKKWKKAGYVIHLMTGVSWGDYQDYLYGRYDGIDHHDEGQRYRNGNECGHGVDVPYMVPSNSFAHYLCEKLKFAVDCGVEAIHLEEPEFWVATGYSAAFKREWEIYYKEKWSDPQASCEAQYKASKLKQYLYTRTLDRLCSELKEYAMVKYNRLIRFYVPTHSLVNYSQWGIVSPESALIDLPTIDGYIAQIWTGTSRTRNIWHGIKEERTFETAFLEYGVMQELVRGTGRRMWYLADPIEDDPKHTWKDYRENYYRTIAASLFHPEISDYEVSPWPGRVMHGRHKLNDEENAPDTRIPTEYKTNLLGVMHALREMKDQTEVGWMTDTKEVGVLMADSAMFQRICPEEGGDASPEFSSFFGLSMPLVKAGIAARPVQLDNIRRFPAYLDAYGTLVLSYEFMKPLSPDIHQGIANWVRAGGKLVYVGDGSDPFNKVSEWWNSGDNSYAQPAAHLFEQLGLGTSPEAGEYAVGNGSVTYISEAPYRLAQDGEKADKYLAAVSALIGENEHSGMYILRRGKYIVTADVNQPGTHSYVLNGTYINMFADDFALVTDPVISAGEVGLWLDVSRIDRSSSADVVCASGRAEKIEISQRSLKFVMKTTSEIDGEVRVWTKRAPKTVTVNKEPAAYTYDEATGTTLIHFGEGTVKVSVGF